MNPSTKVGRDTSSQKEGGLFQTFSDLLKQREALDHQILRMQGRFFKMIEKNSNIRVGTSPTSKKYVARMQNHTILADAIRESMVPGQKMGMQDILSALQNTGAYHTQSSYFYTMVNNKLNRDPQVKKVSRGVFVLQKKTGRSRKKVAS